MGKQLEAEKNLLLDDRQVQQEEFMLDETPFEQFFSDVCRMSGVDESLFNRDE